jgi:hypothetical protein
LERLEIAKPQVVKEASRMNHHKHARLTYARRVEMEMVRQMTEQGLGASEAAMAHGVTPPTARKGDVPESVERMS